MNYKPIDEEALTCVAIFDVASNMKYDLNSPFDSSTTLVDVDLPTKLEETTLLLNSDTDYAQTLGTDNSNTSSELLDENKLKTLKAWGYKDE